MGLTHAFTSLALPLQMGIGKRHSQDFVASVRLEPFDASVSVRQPVIVTSGRASSKLWAGRRTAFRDRDGRRWRRLLDLLDARASLDQLNPHRAV